MVLTVSFENAPCPYTCDMAISINPHRLHTKLIRVTPPLVVLYRTTIRRALTVNRAMVERLYEGVAGC